MNYYKIRIKTMNIIDSLIRENKYTKEEVIFKTMRQTGMSENFILKYIKELQNNEDVTIDKNNKMVWG